jgi:hypothetical protein
MGVTETVGINFKKQRMYADFGAVTAVPFQYLNYFRLK